MRSESKLVHVFLVSFPVQGHVNPLLRLGKHLASKGLLVTFTTPEIIRKQMSKASNITDQPTPVGDGMIRFEFFEDGWDENKAKLQDLDLYLSQLEVAGKKIIPEMIKKNAEQDRLVSCLINNPLFHGSLMLQLILDFPVPCFGFNLALAFLRITTTTMV